MLTDDDDFALLPSLAYEKMERILRERDAAYAVLREVWRIADRGCSDGCSPAACGKMVNLIEPVLGPP